MIFSKEKKENMFKDINLKVPQILGFPRASGYYCEGLDQDSTYLYLHFSPI